MLSRAGSCCLVMMFCAVLITLCKAFLSAAELFPYHTSIPCVRILLMEQRQNANKSRCDKFTFLSILKKYRFCAFLTSAVMFIVHVSSSEMCVLRYLKLNTISTICSLLYNGVCTSCFLLKSIISYFVFLMCRARLFSVHHPISLFISSLEADSSPLVINPTTVVLSANLIMVLVLYNGIQSFVYTEQRNGLSTHPCGAPVLIVKVEEVCKPILTDCGRSVKKSLIHRQMLC